MTVQNPLQIAKEPAAAVAAQPPRAAGSLGNNADFVLTPSAGCCASATCESESPAVDSPVFDIHSVLPPPGTVKAWYQRSVARDLLKSHGITRRMRWCGSRIARGHDGVNVYARPDRAYGRLGGVCVCGQSICCPVCAPRIAARRAEEVALAYQRAMDAGWEPRLETFTKPHVLDRSPRALLREFEKFSDLWRSFQKNADRRERGTEGHHLAREITWGDRNGWHYHHHRLRYDRPGSYDADRSRAQWLATLEGFGLRTEGADEHAYDCEPVTSEAGARYCAKLSTSVEAQARAISSEVASSATKGRNINSLLADYIRGDLQAGAVWVNGAACVTATKISSVRWSRGLRYKLGLDVEKTDAVLAQEEVTATDEFLGSLNPTQWRGVLALKAEFALLCAANRGGDAVNEFLAGLSLGQLNDEDPHRLWTAQRKAGHPGD